MATEEVLPLREDDGSPPPSVTFDAVDPPDAAESRCFRFCCQRAFRSAIFSRIQGIILLRNKINTFLLYSVVCWSGEEPIK